MSEPNLKKLLEQKAKEAYEKFITMVGIKHEEAKNDENSEN